jgi:hypothetical protein
VSLAQQVRVAAMQNQDDWYIARDGEQGGPLTDREMQEFVRAGHLHSEDLIWRPGFDNWQRAGDISVFLQLLPSPPGEADPKLLKTLERTEDSGRPAKNGAATVPVSQKKVATEAGLSRLSETEFKTAVRVANISHEEEGLERAMGLGAVVPSVDHSLQFQQKASLVDRNPRYGRTRAIPRNLRRIGVTLQFYGSKLRVSIRHRNPPSGRDRTSGAP